MATSGKGRCVRCGKEKNAIVRCEGCSKLFCLSDLSHHREELGQQLEVIELDRDVFREELSEQTKNQNKRPLIQQIDQWENDSIKKIRQVADECRQSVATHMAGHFHQLEADLNQLTKHLKELRQEDDFNEINLRQVEESLAELKAKLDKPSNISLEHGSTAFIQNISIVESSRK